MSTITIPDVPDEVYAKLRRRAERTGRLLTEEMRTILEAAVAQERLPTDREEYGLGTAIHEAFRDVGWVDLPDVRDRGLGSAIHSIFAESGGGELGDLRDRRSLKPVSFDEQ